MSANTGAADHHVDDRPNLRSQLHALTQVSNGLSHAQTVDQLCRQAVELGRRELGFDRLGLWFVAPGTDKVTGSYGVDESGQVRMESIAHLRITPDSPMAQVLSGEVGVWFRRGVALRNHDGRAVGEGDHAIAALWNGSDIIGTLCCDNLLSAQPIDEHQLDLLGLYAGTIGHLYSRIRADEALREAHHELEARVAERTAELSHAIDSLQMEVNERADAEQALRESDDRFRVIAENVPGAIYLCANDERYTMQYLNDAVEALTGYPKADFLADRISFVDLYHPDDADVIAPLVDAAIAKRTAFHMTYRIRHRSGEWRWVEEWGTGVFSDGELAFLEGYLHDITDRKAAEQALQRAYDDLELRVEQRTAELGEANERLSQEIVDRKQAESALRESEQALKQHLEAMPVGVFVVRADGTPYYINRMAKDILGKDIIEHVEPDQLAHVYQAYVAGTDQLYPTDRLPVIRALKGETVNIDDMVIRHPDREIPIEVWCSPVTDGQGRLQHAIAAFVDISDRLGAERALRESEERQSLILDTLPMAMFTASLRDEYKATWVSDQIEQLSGFPPHRFVDEAEFWASRIHPEDHARVMEAFNTLGDAESLSIEYRWQCADGTYRWFLDQPVVIRDASGRPVELLGIWLDIEKRKRAEEALRESEQNLRVIFSAAPIGVANVDDRKQFVRVNEAFRNMFGYTEQEMSQLTYVDVTHPDDLDQSLEAMGELYSGQKDHLYMEKRYLRKDGSVMWANLAVSAIRDDNGRQVQSICMLQDMTERHLAQEAVRDHEQKLQALALELTLAGERERRHIAADLHDRIGQTLSLTQIKLESLRKSAADKTTADGLRESVELIRRSVEESRTLMFELSPPVLYDFGLEAAIEWLAEQHQRRTGTRTVLNSSLRDTTLDEATSVLLFRTVRELLINITKYANAHHVWITMRLVEGRLHIEVRDDGDGFDVNAALADSTDDSGFGLFNVREQIERLDGHFEISSTPGLGTRVILETSPLTGLEG